MNAFEFTAALDRNLSPLVHNERTLLARFSSSRGFTTRPLQSAVHVNFINLPEERHKQKRGGGAESENNRMMFSVHGFGEDETVSVDKVKIEHPVCGIPHRPALRGKTASPEKVAEYLARYINDVAAQVPPDFTHD
jgi:hypothetical protein